MKYIFLSIVILSCCVGCPPPRNEQGGYWKAIQIRHRVFAGRDKGQRLDCPKRLK